MIMKQLYRIMLSGLLCVYPCIGWSQFKNVISFDDGVRNTLRLIVNGPNNMPLKNVDAYFIEYIDTIHPSKRENNVLIFSNVLIGEKMLRVIAEGYEDVIDTVRITSGKEIVKAVTMKNRMVSLKAVTVKGKAPAMVIKGDTIQFNPAAANIVEGDVARAILEQMPGVDINETSVKVHGNEIERTYVDGKKIFGDDPMTALDHVDANDVINIKAYEEENKDRFRRADKHKRWVLNISSKSKMINSVDGSAVTSLGKTKGSTLGKHDLRGALGGAFNFFSEDLLLSTNLMHNNENVNSNIQGTLSQVQYNIPEYSENTYTALTLIRNWNQRTVGLKKMDFGYKFIRAKRESTTELIRNYYATEEYAWRRYENRKDNESWQNKHVMNMHVEIDAGKGNAMNIIFIGNFEHNGGMSNGLMADLSNVSGTQTKSSLATHGTIEDIYLRIDHSKYLGKYELSTHVTYNWKSTDKTTCRSLLTENNLNDINEQLEIPGNNKRKELIYKNRLAYSPKWNWLSLMSLQYTLSYDKGWDKQIAYDPLTDDIDSVNTYQYRQDMTDHRIEFLLSQHKGLIEYSLLSWCSLRSLRDNDMLVSEKARYSFTLWQINMNLKVPHLTKRSAIGLEYNMTPQLPNVFQLRKVIDNENPLFVVTGNPSLKQAYSHKLQLAHETKLDKYGKTISTELLSEIISNEIVSRSWYYSQPTFVSSLGYQTVGNSTISSYDNINGTWKLSESISLLYPLITIKSSVKASLSDRYQHRPYYFNGVKDVTRINEINASLYFSTSMIHNTVFSLTDNLSYTKSYAEINSQGAKMLNNTVTANLRIKKIIWNLFMNVNYKMNWQKNISFHRIEHENMLNVYVGRRLYKGRGEVGIVSYDLLNDANKLIFKTRDNYTETSQTTNYGRYVAFTFSWSFRKLNSTRSDIIRGTTW